MDNEVLYCGIENPTPCSYSSLYLSIFLSFKAKFVSQFSPELCKLEYLNVVHTFVEWMIVLWDWDSGSWFLFFFFYPVFFLSLYYMLTLKNFMLEFSQELLKLECWNYVYTWTMNCCIVGLINRTSCSYSSPYLFIFLSFKAKFVSRFSPELFKLESSNVVYICWMSDCIVGLTQDHGSYFSIFIHFSFFPYITC